MNHSLISKALLAATLLAVSADLGWAGCVNPPLSAQAISQFKANPQAIVAPNSDTRTIEVTTRDLAGTDASLAADLIRVAQGTIPRFQTAIAAGLAQAALACGSLDQQAAQTIQEAVASFQDGQFQASFAAVAGDLSTAATVAATAFASNSVGSVIVTNPNTSQGTTTRPGGGGTPVVFQLTSAGSPTIAPATAANIHPSTTTAEPVSPTR
jgi:hypothetical protein